MNSNINPPQPMVIPSSSNMSNVSTSYLSDPKNVAILVLCVLLFFSFLGIAFIPVKLLFILCISEVRCGYKNVPRHPEMAEIQPPD